MNKTPAHKRELRKFGIALAIALAVWGIIFIYAGKTWYIYFIAFSPAPALAALFSPMLLYPVHLAFSMLAKSVAYLITMFALLLLFFVVITPIGIILKITGKDILNIKINKNSAGSYWIPRTPGKKRDYEKQY